MHAVVDRRQREFGFPFDSFTFSIWRLFSEEKELSTEIISPGAQLSSPSMLR